jgi:glucose/arabinose dehydrogenase
MTITRPLRLAALVAAVAALAAPASASAGVSPAPLIDGQAAAAPTGSTIALQKLVDLAQPVLAIGAGDGSNRLFIVQKSGRIRVMKNGALLATPFLDISSLVSKGGEQGLLGLAFSPHFATNHRLYVDYTNAAGDTVIREYRTGANPDVVNPATARHVLTVNQPYDNHNGGMLAFGKDGYLYVGMGDGGSGGDPGNRAQNINQLLGKILRIDVNGYTATRGYRIPRGNPYVGRTGRDEIWQRGVRNPWRFSFDKATGALWIADVGQGSYEEVDRVVRTSTGPGRGVNWGWHVMEGSHCFQPSSGCNRTGKALPLTEYSHAANGRCAVSGGYVYRGTAIAALAGWYVYGDYCSGEVWAVSSTAARPATPVTLLGAGSGRLISAFGQGDDNELYLCDLNGTVYKVVPGA